jgi:hypothetical protein
MERAASHVAAQRDAIVGKALAAQVRRVLESAGARADLGNDALPQVVEISESRHDGRDDEQQDCESSHAECELAPHGEEEKGLGVTGLRG